jgi:hypothetical protein
MKDFWCTEYCWSSYPNNECLQIELKSLQGDKIDFYSPNPLDNYFIKNTNNPILVGIHFKEKLKQLGFNVCEPQKEEKPKQVHAYCGAHPHMELHKLNNFTCAICKIENYHKKKIELLNEKIKWYKNYHDFSLAESERHLTIISDINKKLDELEKSHRSK